MLRCSLSSAYPTHMLKTTAPVNIANDILAPEYFPGKGPIDFSGQNLEKNWNIFACCFMDYYTYRFLEAHDMLLIQLQWGRDTE